MEARRVATAVMNTSWRSWRRWGRYLRRAPALGALALRRREGRARVWTAASAGRMMARTVKAGEMGRERREVVTCW